MFDIFLMFLAQKFETDICEYLLDSGANLEYQSNYMTPILLLATSEVFSTEIENCCKCAKLLIERGANINVSDKFQTSPLIYAVKNKNLKLVELLLASGSDIDAVDSRGCNALHHACNHGNIEIARKLIEAGCNYKLINNSGCTPIDLAYAQGFTDLGTFMDSGCKGIMPMRRTPKMDNGTSAQLKQLSDLEIFLSGLDLLDLLPLLQDQNCISFKQLLTLTDSELEKIGISQLGIRKKILNGVHEANKKDWRCESFPHTREFSRYLSCSEANSMIKNILSQTQYMTSSVAYFRKQLKNDPTVFVSSARNENTVSNVIQSVSISVEQLREIYYQLELLNSSLVKLMKNFPDSEKQNLIDQLPSLESMENQSWISKKWLISGSLICLAVSSFLFSKLNLKSLKLSKLF